MRRAFIPLAAMLASCSFGPALADDEIWGHPAGSHLHAKAGMWITWRCEPGNVTEETLACVADGADGIVIEERETGAQGTTVTSLRYAPDGQLVAAWRGPAGGNGAPLRIVPPPTADDYRAMADDTGARVGVSADDVAARAQQHVETETVATPAGSFECRVHRTDVSALFLTMTITSWHASEPLPLSQLVQYEMKDSWNGVVRRQVLAAYGWSGAVPLLAVAPR